MNPRMPPQLPFARNPGYPPRSPFPPTSTPAPPGYPPVSQAPSGGPGYHEVHSRNASEALFYSQSRRCPAEPGHLPPSNHSRQPSGSSISSAPAHNRVMPPPTSPPQLSGGPSPSSHQVGGSFGHSLPPPRPPPTSVGPSTAFPRGRELPAFETLDRTGSTGSSMSISSIIGAPPPNREAATSSHYPPVSAGGGTGPSYTPIIRASPRMPSNAAEYGSYRRPQTPEHFRLFEHRDHRAAATVSPQGLYSTTEVPRYGTPQAGYGPRGAPMTSSEQAREQMRVGGNPGPPRPSSQPRPFSGAPPPHHTDMHDMYRHREEVRQGDEYNPERPIRALQYEDPRYIMEREYQERQERQERDRQDREMDFRERERMERTMPSSDASRPHVLHPADMARHLDHRATEQRQMDQHRYADQRGPPIGRRPDPRETGSWPPRSGGYEPKCAPYEPANQPPRYREYAPAKATAHAAHQAHPQHPHERFPASLAPHQPVAAGQGLPQVQAHESLERQRMGATHHKRPQPVLHRPRKLDEPSIPAPSIAYVPAEGGPSVGSPRPRPVEEMNGQPGRLATFPVQESNRKGRISPLPQAVQGAQPQMSGPTGEPGIKSEFGRMFSGIGSGVGALSSPTAGGSQLSYASAGLYRRDMDVAAHDGHVDGQARMGRDPTRGKRRKGKDENDEDSTGRTTTVAGRAKKAKTQGQHMRMHTHHHHHHHHHRHGPDPMSGLTSHKTVKDSTAAHSPIARDVPAARHHHTQPHAVVLLSSQVGRCVTAPPSSPPALVIRKPCLAKMTSKAVLDSVAHRPRHHLGTVSYTVTLEPARLQDPRTGRPPRSHYRSTPVPLPLDTIQGKENCTLAVMVGKEHLTPDAREEITSRRAVWGTDVYTDDSDVIGACIHAGWIRGEWPEDVVDINLLDLDKGIGYEDDEDARDAPQSDVLSNTTVFTKPPRTGPVMVPPNCDLQVMLLILPRLQRYHATTRFGIKSREWGNRPSSDEISQPKARHDGLSFLIDEVRFVNRSQDRLRGKARRERIRKALAEVEAWKQGGVLKPPPISAFQPSGGDKENQTNSGARKKGPANRRQATDQQQDQPRQEANSRRKKQGQVTKETPAPEEMALTDAVFVPKENMIVDRDVADENGDKGDAQSV